MTRVIRMRGANGQGVKLKMFRDVIVPSLDGVDPQTAIKHHNDFRYNHGDIIVCSYPKCGYHWMRGMLEKLKSPHDSDRKREIFIEMDHQEYTVNQAEHRLLRTHFKPSYIHPSHFKKSGKIILILRNPKDVAVSYYHHLRNAAFTKSQQSWDEFFESFIEGEVFFGSYFEYLKEWEAIMKRSEGNKNMIIELFYYEDMLLKPEENIDRLNRFLGFGRDASYLQRVLKETTLDALREHYNHNVDVESLLLYDDEGKTVICRKGRVGDWKNHFTASQSEKVDALLRDALQHEIITFKYDL